LISRKISDAHTVAAAALTQAVAAMLPRAGQNDFTQDEAVAAIGRVYEQCVALVQNVEAETAARVDAELAAQAGDWINSMR
jgi:hypothetical protein